MRYVDGLGIDTSSWIGHLRSPAGSPAAEALGSLRVYLPPVVLAELASGRMSSRERAHGMSLRTSRRSWSDRWRDAPPRRLPESPGVVSRTIRRRPSPAARSPWCKASPPPSQGRPRHPVVGVGGFLADPAARLRALRPARAGVPRWLARGASDLPAAGAAAPREGALGRAPRGRDGRPRVGAGPLVVRAVRQPEAGFGARRLPQRGAPPSDSHRPRTCSFASSRARVVASNSRRTCPRRGGSAASFTRHTFRSCRRCTRSTRQAKPRLRQ